MKPQHLHRLFLRPLSCITLLLVVSSCSLQPLRTTEPTKQFSQANIERAIASLDSITNNLRTKTGVPGIAIAVVHNDKTVYAHGFGVRMLGTNLKVDPDTVFFLASISKPLASATVASVVGHGKVKWDDPVQKYLPDFTLSDPDVGKKVTIADMFAHRSGLPDHAGDLLEDIGYSRSEILHQLRLEPLKPYRAQHIYTNFGLTAAAEAVAVAEGMAWEDLAERELYGPLGMTSTSSRWADYNNAHNKADIHTLNAQGKWTISARNPDAQSPAGGASSSVNDMAKWMMLELNQGAYQGKQIIDKNAIAETQREQILGRPATSTSLASYYGLGMRVSHDKANRLRLGHAGAFALGTSTVMELVPSERLGIVVLTNGNPVGVPDTIVKEFYDIAEYGSVQDDWFPKYAGVYADMLAPRGELVGKQPPENPAPALPVRAYTGSYSNDYYGSATVTAKGKNLTLTIGPRHMAFPLSHWDGNTFSFVTTGENATGISAIKFTPANSNTPATMHIEFFSANGFGTFTKI